MSHNSALLAKRDRLLKRISDISLELDAVHEQLVCEVCEGKEDVAIRPIMCKVPICKHCFALWYDSSVMDPAKMRAESLKKQGRFPEPQSEQATIVNSEDQP